MNEMPNRNSFATVWLLEEKKKMQQMTCLLFKSVLVLLGNDSLQKRVKTTFVYCVWLEEN